MPTTTTFACGCCGTSTSCGECVGCCDTFTQANTRSDGYSESTNLLDGGACDWTGGVTGQVTCFIGEDLLAYWAYSSTGSAFTDVPALTPGFTDVYVIPKTTPCPPNVTLTTTDSLGRTCTASWTCNPPAPNPLP